MQIHFSQIYVEQGACFPFTYIFQRYLSKEISSLTVSSLVFASKYGDDWDLVFNISTKHSLQENEIRGPTVFKKTTDVEYTIFLPFDLIMTESDPPAAALNWIFAGAYEVFDRLEIDSSQVQQHQFDMIQNILSDPAMFDDLKHVKIFGSDAIMERDGYEHLDPKIWKAR